MLSPLLLAVCLFLLVVTPGGSCHSTNANHGGGSSPQNEKLATGVWGGQHVRAEVSPGGVQIEFDCAFGAIPEAVSLDAKGRFDVVGTFTAQHAGPVQRDEENNGRPVHYSGQVKEQEMTLTITDPATKEVLGNFTLRHGSDGRLMKCR